MSALWLTPAAVALAAEVGLDEGPDGPLVPPLELISNGGFEDEFGVWRPIVQPGSVSSGWSRLFGEMPGFPKPPGGIRYAVTGHGRPGHADALSQRFTVPAGTASLQLTFDMFSQDWDNRGLAVDPGGLDYTVQGDNQHVRVDILTASAHPLSTTPTDIVTNLYIGLDAGPPPRPFKHYAYELGSLLSPGTSYQFRFGFVANLGGLHAGIDNVSLLATVTAPPPLSYVTNRVVVSTVAGSVPGYSNGPAATALFKSPEGICWDPTGNLFVADTMNMCIRRISTDGVVTTVAGGKAGYVDGLGTEAQFRWPTSVDADSAGNLVVADLNNGRIRSLGVDGAVRTLAGIGGYGYVDGPAKVAQFHDPIGVVFDGAGNVLIADSTNHVVRHLSVAGQVTTWAGSGEMGHRDGPGTTAQFFYPQGLALHPDGTLYVADWTWIRKVTPAGEVSTVAGDSAAGFMDGPGAQARFRRAFGIAVDEDGTLYVADRDNAALRRISPAGVVETLAGTGSRGNSDGTGRQAQFNNPAGIALAESGILYVADSGNSRVRRIEIEMPGDLPPAITGQPQDQTVTVDGTAVFTVDAAGTPPLTFQWRKDGVDLAGATSQRLSLPHIQLADAGVYTAVVSNASGAVTSRGAVLTVTPPPRGAIEFSTRAGSFVNAPVTIMSADDSWLVDGRFVAQLYAGAPGQELQPVGVPVPFRDDDGKGYITAGGTVVVPSVEAGEKAQVKMVAWLRAYGATYAETQELLLGYVGESGAITVTTGGGTQPPALLTGLQGFAISPILGLPLLPFPREGAPVVVWTANGHGYQRVYAPYLPWAQARRVAEGMIYQGKYGHLATITFAEENRFLTEHPDLGNSTASLLDHHWIGAYWSQETSIPEGAWRWVTDEPFAYANWPTPLTNGPPAGDNHVMMSAGSGDSGQFWGTDNVLTVRGYIIEYDSVIVAPPSVVSVRVEQQPASISVVFSEPMETATARDPSNYSLSGATSDPEVCAVYRMPSPNTVTLWTSIKRPGWYTLRVHGVRQAAEPKQSVDPESTILFAVNDGQVSWSLYDQAGTGGTVADILGNACYQAGQPNRRGFFSSFEFPGYENGAELIGQLRAFLFPPVTGSYRFWMYGDEACLLYLSTDDDPRQKRLIGRLDAPTGYRIYQPVSPPVTLETGRRYYLEAVYKEVDGGDGVGVAWQRPGGPEPRQGDPPISGQFLSSFTKGGFVEFVRFPTSQHLTVESGQPVDFGFTEANLDGTPPYSFRWYRDQGGALQLLSTNANFVLPWATPDDDGRRYLLQPDNAYATIFCDESNRLEAEIILHVLPDKLPPVVEWVAGTVSGTQIQVRFSEAVALPAATNLANYSLNGGPLLRSAVRQSDGRTILLETTAQTLGATYELGIRDVADMAGNPLTVETRVSFPAFAEFPGMALREVWTSTWLGTSIETLLRLPRFTGNQPSFRQVITALESPTDVTNHYGQRLSGWISPPATGDYLFAIAANDSCRLFLSRDDSAAGLALIASHDGWTNPKEWTKYPSQKSSPISLVAGGAYYFEALMVEDSGGDNLAVGWIPPNSDSIEVIGGANLRLRTDPRDVHPTLVRQPVDLLRYQYVPGVLSVDVRRATYSQGTLRFQWQRNGVDVPGATTPELFLQPSPDTGDTGARYRCLVMDAGDPSEARLVSTEAEVSVLPQDEPSPLRIQRNENGLLVTWRAEPGLRLQSSTRFRQLDWQDVPGTDGQGAMTFAPSNQAMLLRLWKSESTPSQPDPNP